MKLNKNISVFFCLLFLTSVVFAGSIHILKTPPDSTFLKDNPVVAQLDSLVNCTVFKKA